MHCVCLRENLCERQKGLEKFFTRGIRMFLVPADVLWTNNKKKCYNKVEKTLLID